MRLVTPISAKSPVYPFANISNTTYMPLCNCNIRALPNIPVVKKDGLAYKTTVPIYDKKITSKVYNQAMST